MIGIVSALSSLAIRYSLDTVKLSLQSLTQYSIQLISRSRRQGTQDRLVPMLPTSRTRHWRTARRKWARQWCFLGVTTLWIIGSNRRSRADCRCQQEVTDKSLFFPLSSSLGRRPIHFYNCIYTLRHTFDLRRLYTMSHYVTCTLTVTFIPAGRFRSNGQSSLTLRARENQIGK